jgi:hypothetical protein
VSYKVDGGSDQDLSDSAFHFLADQVCRQSVFECVNRSGLKNHDSLWPFLKGSPGDEGSFHMVMQSVDVTP